MEGLSLGCHKPQPPLSYLHMVLAFHLPGIGALHSLTPPLVPMVQLQT